MTPKQIETTREEIKRILTRMDLTNLRMSQAFDRNAYAEINSFAKISASDAYEVSRLTEKLVRAGLEV